MLSPRFSACAAGSDNRAGSRTFASAGVLNIKNTAAKSGLSAEMIDLQGPAGKGLRSICPRSRIAAELPRFAGIEISWLSSI